MYWPKDEAALTVAAAGFDTLLYTQPPPLALGFNTVKCIGEVCVAERRGGCRSLPVTPIPVPDALREIGTAQATFSGWKSDGNMALARPVDSIH
jgi:hypothetical protein